MLERAAGCLENAGRRFFQDSNGAIRGPRSLHPHFWQSSGTSTECSQWFLVSPQGQDQRASNTSATLNASRTINETRTPFLEFLYPPRTQEFLASCLLRSPKRLVPRRRKRPIPSLSRTYTSEAASLHQPRQVDKPVAGILRGREEENHRRHAKERLVALLAKGETGQNDTAWALYATAGHPLEFNSALLARLSSSTNVVDNRRAQRLFDGISIESRSAEDYLNMAKSHLAVGKTTAMTRICKEATSRGLGIPCWAFTFTHFVNNTDWDLVQKLWNLRPQSSENELLESIASHLHTVSISKNMLSLATSLHGLNFDNSSRDFARFLLGYVFSTAQAAEHIPTETLLLLLREYNALGILKPDHYFDLIRTLQSSELRSTFIRSIVVYRNFRWQMDKEVPPANILARFLRSLASFNITTGIQYFLDEFVNFFGKPSIDAYRNALVAFSRSGDMGNVNKTFERYVLDYGKPSSRRLLTPLLYVHARVGNVRETLYQFKRISKEFSLKPNTVCWNILLTAYANSDDLSGSFTTFQKMLKEGVEPNSHTFGTIMGLCAHRGDVETVRHLLDLAKKRHVQITAPLLDTIVEAYCSNHKLDLAESVAETCLGLDIKGSRVRMWNLLLWNYAFRMDLESISRIRSRMDAAGLQPDGMTYAALMLSLVLIGQTDSARRILRTLHRSHRMYAMEFHYAIILYGYIKDRNRDMVHIIFREIKERFSRLGFSSSLLVLKNQLQRDLDLIKNGGRAVSGANVRLENAEKFLAETIAEFDITALATKQPSPGAGRQSISQAFPAMYYEYIITAYGTRGASDKVRELFDQFISKKSPIPAENAYDAAPLRLVSALMLTHLKAEQYKKVEECWETAFPRAIKMASRVNLDEWLAAPLPPTETVQPPRPSVPKSVGGHKELLVVSETPVAFDSNESSILPACRFLLSRPLSLYMRSLAYRNETWRIPLVVAEVENAGFVLTTFNWSTFVQMLASSERPSDQVEAFTIFEQKFMPNFPGWSNLRRGYGVKPPGVPPTIDVMENARRGKPPHFLGKESRRYWSKIQPDFMQPTYISMVYLASALHGFRERSIYDGGAEVKALYDTAPKTIEAIADMPYLREKFQGVLLRRREEQGDKGAPTEAHEPFVWTGGILGVGGRPRPPTTIEQLLTDASKEEDVSTEDPVQSDQLQQTPQPAVSRDSTAVDEDFPPEELSMPLRMTIDSQDEYDIEAETLLESRHKSLEATDEWMDNEHRESPGEKSHAGTSTLVEGLPPSTKDALEATYQEERDASYNKDQSGVLDESIIGDSKA